MKEKYLLGLGAMLLFVGFLFGLSSFQDARNTEASTIIGGEYQSTITRRMPAGTAITNLTVLKSGAGTLGSVVITGAGTGVLTLYDATSTVTNTEWATTTLATFPASTAAGTYTFDVIFRKGLLIDYSGTVGTTTITYR